MYTRVALRKSTYSTLYTWLVLHNTCTFPKYVTIYIKTHMYLLHTQLFFLQPTCSSCRCQKEKFLKVWVVWVVMQLTPSVVTTLSSTLSLHKHINRGREVHERVLELFHCHVGGIWILFAHTFSLEAFSLCCKAWRLSSLEKRSSRTISRFCEVPNLKRRYTCTSFHD